MIKSNRVAGTKFMKIRSNLKNKQFAEHNMQFVALTENFQLNI